ncbi:hypothetical protein ACIODW_06525 [Streptomyces sp. NPDC087897]|uniref:hypothetical protein n=1 Tax=Streptomyces sp. NPDC087897 TaxID=3365817 RepID=UPI00380056CF
MSADRQASTATPTTRRNTAGRCFNRLKAIRGIATGCDKTAPSYEAAVSLPSLLFSARSL